MHCLISYLKLLLCQVRPAFDSQLLAWRVELCRGQESEVRLTAVCLHTATQGREKCMCERVFENVLCGIWYYLYQNLNGAFICRVLEETGQGKFEV